MQVRIEQVLLGSPQLLLCFTVSQLLAFYGTTVDRLLGSEGQLTEVLVSCHQLAKRVFHEQLKRRGDQLVRSPPAPPKDLSPPQQVRAVISRPSLSDSAMLIAGCGQMLRACQAITCILSQLKGQGTRACALRHRPQPDLFPPCSTCGVSCFMSCEPGFSTSWRATLEEHSFVSYVYLILPTARMTTQGCT